MTVHRLIPCSMDQVVSEARRRHPDLHLAHGAELSEREHAQQWFRALSRYERPWYRWVQTRPGRPTLVGCLELETGANGVFVHLGFSTTLPRVELPRFVVRSLAAAELAQLSARLR